MLNVLSQGDTGADSRHPRDEERTDVAELRLSSYICMVIAIITLKSEYSPLICSNNGYGGTR